VLKGKGRAGGARGKVLACARARAHTHTHTGARARARVCRRNHPKDRVGGLEDRLSRRLSYRTRAGRYLHSPPPSPLYPPSPPPIPSFPA
jgi:hypothetical protein